VTVTSDSGDSEQVILKPAFSPGVFVGSIPTELGAVKKGDHILQVIGEDHIHITYIVPISPDGNNKPVTYACNLATDAKFTMLSRSALDVYKEAAELQKKEILDENWEVIGTLPDSVSNFFRDPETGALRRRGYRFRTDFLTRVKPGQPVYVESTNRMLRRARNLQHQCGYY